MRKKFFAFMAGILMMTGATMPVQAFADGCNEVKFFGLDPWYSALTCTNGEIDQSNFESGQITTTVMKVIGVVVKDLLFFAGMAAVVLIMYGGFLFVTSGGNPGSVEKAKKTISGALIGLVISILAYAIATAVLKVVTGA